MYIQKIGQQMTIVAVYVDDILIALNDCQHMKKLKQDLMKTFEMKDMGPVHYCLGIEFKQDAEMVPSLCHKIGIQRKF